MNHFGPKTNPGPKRTRGVTWPLNKLQLIGIKGGEKGESPFYFIFFYFFFWGGGGGGGGGGLDLEVRGKERV